MRLLKRNEENLDKIMIEEFFYKDKREFKIWDREDEGGDEKETGPKGLKIVLRNVLTPR